MRGSWFFDADDKPEPAPRATGPTQSWKCADPECDCRWQGPPNDNRCWKCKGPGMPANEPRQASNTP